tara:strand:+ start:128 stop:961 length:834 start_codon:yes stop_codon:yes gene_type:complete
MKIKPFCIIALVLMSLLPNTLFGIGCKQLNTPKKIAAFLVESQRSNPFLRKNVSVSLEISACEGKVCKKKKLRASKKELLHFQRIGKNRRVFFAKGPNAPRCVILRGNRQYVCSQCRKNANENCRSFPSDDSSLLPGTNIDLADFELLTQGVKSSKCSELKKQPNYFKIDLRRKAKGYDRIVAYYDKKKKVPITMNFFSSKVMRKVYRFFPKYYIRVENQWFSTVLRVRTTQGKEKSYVFETLVHVAKEGKKLRLFTDALRDPHLKGVSADSLFITD